jgi:putative membrane protein
MFLDAVSASLAGLPPFLMYFSLAILLVLLFMRIYTWITPHHEWDLIRDNNPAAAIAFGGALIGFSLPLSSAITQSMSLLDCAVWGAVALIIQLLTFMIVRLLLSSLSKRIIKGEVAAGIFTAACAIAVGLINAASMTY